MNTSDLLISLIIIILFTILILYSILGVGLNNIQKNWALYRCNPMIMPFAGIFNANVADNFSYCIQNMQTSIMSEFLDPLHYSLGIVSDISSEANGALNSVRSFFNDIRSWITTIISSIMSVFLNILIEIQRLTINIKDVFAKLVGTLATLLYMLSGSIMTMNATWGGPPGQIVRAVCFHPKTLVKTKTNELIEMQNLKPGDKLKNGEVVNAIMNINNLDDYNNHVESLYTIQNGENKEAVIVSGSHLIFDKDNKKFVQVKDYSNSILTNINSDNLCCLITSNHIICLGKHIFHDWEDNNGSPSKTL
jgi:hypothetical protein